MKKQFLKILSVFIGLVLAAGLCAAQPAEEDPSLLAASPAQSKLSPVDLSSLTQEALEKNPDIRAAKFEWRAFKKRIIQSWSLPDPMVGMDFMGEDVETAVGPEMNRFMVSQQIPFPWKLWQKRKIAKAQAESKRQEYLAVERDILNMLQLEFYNLYLADASLHVIQEVHEILKKFESVTQSRYVNRTGSQRDVAKAQAEVALTLEQLYRLEQQRGTITARLNAILNRDPFSEYGQAVRPELSKVNQTLVELVNGAVKNRQEIQVQKAKVKEAKYTQTLARLENIPDVEVGFTYTWVGSGMTTSMDDGKDSWMIPLRMNVPLWQNRIIASVKEAKDMTQAAEATLEASHNQIFYDVKDAYARYQSASKTVALYETAIIPQAKLALTSDQAGYEGGKVDFLNLLDSERVYLNAKLSAIKIFTEALSSVADLERAVGSRFEEEKS